MNGVVELRNVSKSFRDPDGRPQQALRALSFRVAEGQRIRIDGPSGAGKSTLLNIISGLLRPDVGTVSVAGADLLHLSEAARDRFRAKHIGYIFQSFNLLSPLTVRENLTAPLRLAGNRRPRLAADAADVLERLGLGAHANKRPYQLSIGQRQRVAVARALLQQPDVLLADEPTASLDAGSAQAVRDALMELNRAGATLVLATHDPAFVSLEFDCIVSLGSQEVEA